MKALFKKVVISATAIGLFNLGLSYAEETKFTNKSLTKSEQYISSAGERSGKSIKEHEVKKLVKEALDVVLETNKVMYLLSQNKIDEAKNKLKDIKQKLNNLSTNYKIKKFPIDVSVIEIRGEFDIRTAEKLAQEAKKAVNENDFVKGREILNTLRDEFVIQTTYLPLNLYKNSIELADKFLSDGKIKSAIAQLQVAIGTLEVETTIIPRPLAIASILIEDASKIYKKDPNTALKLLQEAKNNIKLAKILGYIKTYGEVRPLLKEIDNVRNAIQKKQNKEGLFDKLKNEMENLKNLFK